MKPILIKRRNVFSDWQTEYRLRFSVPKKKVFPAIASGVGAILLLTVILLLATAHRHSFGEWRAQTPAGCESEGAESRTCTCGKTETRPLAPLGHTEVTDEAVLETCSSAGLTEESHCARCSKIFCEQTVIPLREPSPGLCFVSNGSGTCTLPGTGT